MRRKGVNIQIMLIWMWLVLQGFDAGLQDFDLKMFSLNFYSTRVTSSVNSQVGAVLEDLIITC